MSLLIPRAIRVGVLGCVLITAPAALLQSNLSGGDFAGDQTDRSNWLYLTLLAIVIGYLLGGALAARVAVSAPMINGAVAAVLAFLVVQLVAGVFRLINGEGINLLALVFNALLAAAIGTVGGGLGAYIKNRGDQTNSTANQ